MEIVRRYTKRDCEYNHRGRGRPVWIPRKENTTDAIFIDHQNNLEEQRRFTGHEPEEMERYLEGGGKTCLKTANEGL